MILDNELIFWDKATTDTSEEVNIGSLGAQSQLPEIALQTSPDATLEGSYLLIEIQHYIGAWDIVQTVLILSSHFESGKQIHFTIPSCADERIRLALGANNGLATGTITASLSLDQQTNL